MGDSDTEHAPIVLTCGGSHLGASFIMQRYKYDVQEVTIGNWADSYTVYTFTTIAPFVTVEEEQHFFPDGLDPCEPKWWAEKYLTIPGNETSGPRCPVLDDVLEVYSHFGWDHYNSVLMAKEHPEHVENPDDVKTTLLLFFRKLVPTPI